MKREIIPEEFPIVYVDVWQSRRRSVRSHSASMGCSVTFSQTSSMDSGEKSNFTMEIPGEHCQGQVIKVKH